MRKRVPINFAAMLNAVDGYCDFVGKDRLQFLREIPLRSLHNFFHWLLTARRKSIREASSLQTYWNVFGLIRKKETGLVFIDPTIKAQMTAVRKSSTLAPPSIGINIHPGLLLHTSDSDWASSSN